MADRYLRASGSWNGPVWAATSGGAAGSVATPTSNDVVYISANFTVTLAANENCFRLVHTNGTVALNSYKLSVQSDIRSLGTTSRTINLNSGTLEVALDSGYVGSGLLLEPTNLSFNAGTSLVSVPSYAGTGGGVSAFDTASKIFNDVSIRMGEGSTSTTLNITGSPTFRTLDIRSANSAAHTVNFDGDFYVNKLIAIGSSASNRLTLKKQTSGGMPVFVNFQPSATMYGQALNLIDIVPSQVDYDAQAPTFAGSNSVEGSGASGWLLQDPPKIATLVDPLTTSSGANDNWTVNYGTTTQVSTGKGGGGYRLNNASLTSTTTYDLVDSEIIFEQLGPYGGTLFNSVNLITGPNSPSLSVKNDNNNYADGYTAEYTNMKGQKTRGSVTTGSFKPAFIRIALSSSTNKVTYSAYYDSTWNTVYEATIAPEDMPYFRSTRVMMYGGGTVGSVGIGPGPVADFSVDTASGTRPLLVHFTDQSSLFTPTSWSWTFGDGGTSTTQNPQHTYTQAGTYTVSLTASDGTNTRTVTKNNLITANPQVFARSIEGTLLFGGSVERPSVIKTRSITGTLLFGGSVDRPEVTHIKEISGGLLFGGEARAIVIKDVQALPDKKYLYKVYDEDGTYIEVWKDVISVPSFTREINSIGSSMEIELARTSDSLGVTTEPLLTEDGAVITTESGQPLLAAVETRNQIGPDSSVQYNNRVDIYAYYGQVEPLLTEEMEPILTEDGEPILAQIGAPNGVRIFSGFINDINTRYGNTDTVVVQLTSYGWDLNQYPITTEDGKTTVPFYTTDPSDIVRQAMDKFVADSDGYGTYTHRTKNSIDSTGSVVTYTFRANTYADVLDKALELMPSNWYYYIDLGTNVVHFRQRQTTPRHLFYLGKHIKSLDLRGSTLDVKNHVLFTGGGDPALFVERKVAPAPRTRRGLELRSDSRVTIPTTAEILSDGVIEEQNKVQYRTTLEVLAGQYDIESINEGDEIGFRNFDNFVDNLTMQVIGISYTPDAVQLQLDSKSPTINQRIEDIRRNMKITENQALPDQPS